MAGSCIKRNWHDKQFAKQFDQLQQERAKLHDSEVALRALKADAESKMSVNVAKDQELEQKSKKIDQQIKVLQAAVTKAAPAIAKIDEKGTTHLYDGPIPPESKQMAAAIITTYADYLDMLMSDLTTRDAIVAEQSQQILISCERLQLAHEDLALAKDALDRANALLAAVSADRDAANKQVALVTTELDNKTKRLDKVTTQRNCAVIGGGAVTLLLILLL